MKQETKDLLLRSGIVSLENSDIELPDVLQITKDMKNKILHVTSIQKDEIRTIVNLYYQIQEVRIGISEQIRSLEKRLSGSAKSSDANLLVLRWILANVAGTEKGIYKILDLVCQSDPVGRWLRQIYGIGPALAAGCLAYFDVNGRQYASQFISYAGLNDNNRPWLGREKSKRIIAEVLEENHAGEKKIIIDQHDVEMIAARTQWKIDYLRDHAFDETKDKWDRAKLEAACAKIPYNADLKVIMWRVGKSFEYLKSNPNSLYGKLLAERIAIEIRKNENGEFKDLIEKHMSEKTYGKGTKTYTSYMEGKLPDSEINARCRRWVQKIFISHLFEEMYRVANDAIPPRYYALEHCNGQHNRNIEPEVAYDKVTGEE